MRVWMVIVLVGLLKMPLVALLLWLPFRDDPAATDQSDSSQDDGGSKTRFDPTRPRHPRAPLPRLPRRGPHGGMTDSPPPRMRQPGRRQPLVTPHR